MAHPISQVTSGYSATSIWAPAAAALRPDALSSGPQESYQGQSSGSLTKPSAMTAWMAAHKQQYALIDGMLDSQGPAAATPQENADMHKALSVVDTGVLRLAHDNGVKVGVVHDGADMNQLGELRPKSLEDYQSQMPQLRQLADRFNQAAAPFDGQIDALQQKIDALGPDARPPLDDSSIMPDGGRTPSTAKPPTALQLQAQDLSAQMGKLTDAKEAAQAKLFDENSMATPFLPIASEHGNPQTDLYQNKQLLLQMDTPQSTANLAVLSGATTPEQIKEYNSLVEGINGDRLTTARSGALVDLQKAVDDAKTPEDKKLAQDSLNEAKADPSQISVDFKKNNLLVPDLYYRDDGKGGQNRLTYVEAESLMDWAGSDSSKALPLGGGQGHSDLLGQYYPDVSKVLVRANSIADVKNDTSTAVHELGHAIDGLVKQKDPEFYGGWKEQLDKAYERVNPKPDGHFHEKPVTISEYARTSPAEYIAEGVSNYYHDPKMLKSKDPALYHLTQQLLSKADALGNAQVPQA